MSGGFSFAPPAKDGGNVSRMNDAQAQPPLSDDMRTLQPGAEYWLDHTPDLGHMKADQLLDEMRQIEQWKGRQIASTPQMARMKAVQAQMQAGADALGRKAFAKSKPAKKSPGKGKGKAAKADDGATPAAPLPRILREHSSIQTSEPKALAAEYDEIVEALQRDDLAKGDREILQSELLNLGPAMGQELEQRAAKRQAETVTGALTHPQQSGGTVDALDIAKRIDSVRPLSGRPGMNYLMDGNEMIVIPDAQLKAIKASVVQNLASQSDDIHQRNEDVQADMHEFVDRTYEKHKYVGALSMIGSGENPLDWDEKIMPRVRDSNMARNRFADLAKKAQDPWNGEAVTMESMAMAINKADVFADGARYAFDSRQDKMFAATAAQVKVLQTAKFAGQLAANYAFSPAGAALYAALEDSAVQGMEIHYGQRDSFDYAGVLIDAGAAYVGGKVNSGITGLAGKEAGMARKALFFAAGDRAGAAATTVTSMAAHDAASEFNIGAKSDQKTFSASDMLGAGLDQLTDVKGLAVDAVEGKVGHMVKSAGARGSGSGRGGRGGNGARGSAPAETTAPVEATQTAPTQAAQAAPAKAAASGSADLSMPLPSAQAPSTTASAKSTQEPALTMGGTRPAEGSRTTTRAEWKAMDHNRRANDRMDRQAEPIQEGEGPPRETPRSADDPLVVAKIEGSKKGRYWPRGTRQFKSNAGSETAPPNSAYVVLPESQAKALGFRSNSAAFDTDIRPRIVNGVEAESSGAGRVSAGADPDPRKGSKNKNPAHPVMARTARSGAGTGTGLEAPAVDPIAQSAFQRTIGADVSQSQGYNGLLTQGEKGLLRPGNISTGGVDAITASVENGKAKVFLNDFTTPDVGKGEKTTHENWGRELQALVDQGRIRFADPNVQSAVLDAIKSGEVYVRTVRVTIPATATPGATRRGGTAAAMVVPDDKPRKL